MITKCNCQVCSLCTSLLSAWPALPLLSALLEQQAGNWAILHHIWYAKKISLTCKHQIMSDAMTYLSPPTADIKQICLMVNVSAHVTFQLSRYYISIVLMLNVNEIWCLLFSWKTLIITTWWSKYKKMLVSKVSKILHTIWNNIVFT